MTLRHYFWLVNLLLLAGCYEPREGCLDVSAVNFDAAADENCCCEYPALKMSVLHRFDSLVWQPDSVYLNNLGQAFRLRSVALYLSGFGLEQNGQIYRVQDTIALKTRPPAGQDTLLTTFVNDFQLLRRTPTEYTIGLFPFAGAFQSVRFTVGLPDSAQTILPAQTPQGHPLQPQPEGLWLGQDTAYAHLFLVVQSDTAAGARLDTLRFSRLDFDAQMIKDTRNFVRETGFDFKIRLTINYAVLFKNLNWQNGDISAWKMAIAANLPQAFSVSQ
jgi:hypothetical protein